MAKNSEPRDLSSDIYMHLDDVQDAIGEMALTQHEYDLLMQVTHAFIDLALAVDPWNEIAAGKRGTMKPRNLAKAWDDEEEGKPEGNMRSRRGVLRDLAEARDRILLGVNRYEAAVEKNVPTRRAA